MRLASLSAAGALGALLVCAAAGAAAQGASDAELSRQSHRIAQDVMSPFCPGRTLADCPSPDAHAVREQIRDLLAAGVAESQVRARLEQTYGDAVVGVPRSALGWLLPVLLLLAGAGLLVAVLRRLSAAGSESPSEVPPDGVSGVLEAELERELRTRGL